MRNVSRAVEGLLDWANSMRSLTSPAAGRNLLDKARRLQDKAQAAGVQSRYLHAELARAHLLGYELETAYELVIQGLEEDPLDLRLHGLFDDVIGAMQNLLTVAHWEDDDPVPMRVYEILLKEDRVHVEAHRYASERLAKTGDLERARQVHDALAVLHPSRHFAPP